jgi:hypothetical protein
MADRVPLLGGTKFFGYWDRIGTCAYSHALNLTGARPASFLPVILEDDQIEAPIVMYPGTIVGVLNSRDQDSVDATFVSEFVSPLVPAHGHASGYTLTYTALDLATAKYGGSADADEDPDTVVAATGASTAVVKPCVPYGVVQEPVYSSYFQKLYTNLSIQPKINVLSRGRVLRVACITAEEKSIYPGDLVMVSTTAGSHDPINNPATSYPGRWKAWDNSAATFKYVVGKCVGRHRIVRGTAVAGTLLKTDIQNAGLTASTLNAEEGYKMLNRVQTAPGFMLTGSGTSGVPGQLIYARADSSGDYWAIDISIGIPGI